MHSTRRSWLAGAGTLLLPALRGKKKHAYRLAGGRGSFRLVGADSVNYKLDFNPPTVYSGPIVGGGAVQAGDFFVSPGVTYGNGDGSFANPWNIRTAFQFGGTQLRGKTVWMRDGTYTPVGDGSGLPSYWVAFDGLTGSRVTCRSYPGEWARIDGGTTDIGTPALRLQGNYYTLRDFEVFSSEAANDRITTTPGPAPGDIFFGHAIKQEQDTNYSGIRMVNLVLHDTSEAIAWWEQAVDSVCHGNVIYYNGWEATGDDGHGHGIYAHNFASPGGTKTCHENVIFRNFGVNFHGYETVAQTQKNFNIQGNVLFASGVAAAYRPQRNFLIGGDADPVGDSTNTIASNFLYDAAAAGSDFMLGDPTPHNYDSPVVQNNFMPQIGVTWFASGSSANITGNILTHTEGDAFDIGAQNTFRGEPLTGTDIVVRPNAYEPGRANIVVYNWDLNNTVSANVSSVLSVGDKYVVYNCQNILGSPVLSGIYSGSNLTLPMTTAGGLTQAAPFGYSTPPATWPKFNVFLLRKT